MRVIIANEHYLLRESLRMLLAMTEDYQVVAEPADEANLLQALVNQPADILLCDSELPCKDLAKMIKHIAELQPNLELVLFTETLKAKQLKQRFTSSVAVVIDKDNAGDNILATLEKLNPAKTALKEESKKEQALNI